MTTSIEKAEAAPAWVDDLEFEEAGTQRTLGGRRWRRWVLVPVVLLLLVAGAVWFLNPFGTTAAARLVTAKVTTGTIVASVAISGSVASSTVDELNFSASGTVSAVNVVAGQKVAKGQVLATLDDTALKAQLATAQANLTAAQDRLATDQAGPTAATVASANDAVAQANLQLSTAKQSLSDTIAQNDQSVAQAQATLTAAQAQLASDSASLPPGDPQIAKDQTAVTNAQTALSAAQLKATLSLHQAQAQVQSATLSLSTAQHNYTLKVAPATGAQIASDQAAVAQAQQALATLQSTGASITSPVDGTVTVVNVKVGQSVSGGNGNSSASSSSGSTATTGQIEVMDLSHLQIAGQASETDIPKLKLDQPATITATALGSDTVVGKVCSLGVVGTQISGVTSFPVTVCLDGTNAALRVGMSATAAVVTDRADDAMLVPSLSVKTVGGQQVVAVLGADGKTQTNVPVTVGLTNGTETQILSGLSGTETVVESVQSTTQTRNGFGGAGGRILGGGLGG